MGAGIRGKPAARRRRAAIGAGVAAAAIIAASWTQSAASASPAKPAATVAVAARTSVAAVALTAYTPPARNLAQGMRGADVTALQQRLAALKYYPGPADGQFGPATLEAVWAFQEVNGIPATGVVGTATKRALVNPRTYRAHNPGQAATRVEINLTMRVLVLFKNRQIALISHVSAGGGYYYCSNGGCAYAITPTGTFWTRVYMPGWIKVPLGEMYNSVFFIGTAYAIHGDTYVPVYPASHGCVRIPMDIAAFFHTMIKTPGTEVIIFR